jgi:hypothetical protein
MVWEDDMSLNFLRWPDLDLRAPYVERGHTTYGVQLQPYQLGETAPGELNSARVSGLGDVRLYSDLDGYQLFPQWTAAVGANYAF